jgi:hypothetical protein
MQYASLMPNYNENNNINHQCVFNWKIMLNSEFDSSGIYIDIEFLIHCTRIENAPFKIQSAEQDSKQLKRKLSIIQITSSVKRY